VRRSRIALAAVALSGGGAVAALTLPLGPAASADDQTVAAKLQLADGSEVGTVRFTTEREWTTVKVMLNTPFGSPVAVRSFHGLHVHANDDPANGEGCVASPGSPANTWFTSADGHMKQFDQTHGGHDGDLPPLLVDGKGHASTRFTTDRITADQLVGKAVVLHAGADNLGNVPVGLAPDQYTPNSPTALDKTHATGNAGDRIACGVIQRDD
jgi:Cu-Zn family superoxide dismutase